MSFGRLKSREERQREQRRRMARGRRNLSQLAGPVAQGQRTPMNRGSGSVSTLEAPKFQQSNPGADITQAAAAYKGAKGIHDFTTGTEAYTDKAGNVIPAKAPFSFGDKSILGEGGHVDEYFGKVGNRWDEATEGAKSLFGTPTPQPGFGPAARVPAAGGGGIFGSSTTPTSPPTGSYGVAGGMGSFTSPMDASTQAMQKWNLGGDVANISGLQMPTQQGILGIGATGGMSGVGTGATTGSNLLGASNSAFAGAQAGADTANAINAANAASATAEVGSGLQGADAAASGAGGTPWLAYANIGKDLIMGGPGSEKITGSTAGDAAIRAAAAYFTFGLSEIPYALF